MISSQNTHSCAIASDNLGYCWGRNLSGQLGSGGGGHVLNTPQRVYMNPFGPLGGRTLKSISTGRTHSCAIDDIDRVHCWGTNNRGQLGDGTKTNSGTPVLASAGALSGKTIVSLALDNQSSCAIDSNGIGYCFGWYIGNDVTSPQAIGGELIGKTITQIGGQCALTTEQKVYCWGFSGFDTVVLVPGIN